MDIRNKKPFIIIIIILFIILLIPYLIYYTHFKSSSLSDYNNDWGNFGNFINGTLAPIITLIGLLISYVIYKVNIKRQEMAQRPLLYIKGSDYENDIELNLYNKGLGPLIITEYRLVNSKTKKTYKGIYYILEDIKGTVNNYTGNFDNLVLSAGEGINLFKLSIEAKYLKEDKEFILKRDIIREKFSELQFVIKYKDIYENIIEPVYKKDLNWFGRNKA